MSSIPSPPATPLDAFGAAVRRIAPLGDAALAELAALTEAREVGTGVWLLQAGQRAEWGLFVVGGLLRECYIDAEGDEHTRAFAPAGGFSGSLLDLLSGQPSVTWVQALEPTRLLAFRYAAFDALCRTNPELNMLARRLAERLYLRKARREYELLALPAAARYAQWCAEHPQLDARVSRRVLASFLGVTPEHLSRLRREAVHRPAGPGVGGSSRAA
ncbi:MAG: Crp/Fnr family transcriptional regulator [Pelomonas sp.]|nr:Crp/Fnr family transcriptional regulator [Roseateles sp.]